MASRFLFVLFISLSMVGQAPGTYVTFDGTKDISSRAWAPKELNPNLPSDWSDYGFLVLTFRASSPQEFKLSIQTAGGPAGIKILPYANAWVRAALPLEYFEKLPTKGTDMASISNKSHIGYFAHLAGPYRPLQSVEGITVSMTAPLGKPVLEIRSVDLAKNSPGDAVLETHPLVDKFGQWIDAGWNGKITDLAHLRKDWTDESKSLSAGHFDYCRYGGYKKTSAKATGFFRVEQRNGKWWFVDPDGHLFFSTGADATRPEMATPTSGRNSVFAALPPASLSDEDSRAGGASFFTWNIFRRFGSGWRTKWVDFTIRRMNDWGLNTTGNWSDPHLWDSGRIVYTVPLGGWQTNVSYMGMPDVYAKEFAENCDRAAARQCGPRARDPYLLGYFTANEPPWPAREAALVTMILDGPDTATRRELRAYLSQGDTPERRKSFVYMAYEKYLDVICKAVKKHDPNHLNLGMRFAGGRAPDAMIRASRVFDVYSLNSYEVAPAREMLDRAYELTGRPLMIGEFHFGSPGRGLAAGLRQVASDRERGTAYRYYIENAAAMPALIGAHWFEWADEPSTGRFDGENYNIGFVDVTDRPYKDFLEGVKEAHKDLYAVHSGTRQPVSTQARVH